MTTSRSLLFVHALTSLHPGSGTSVGTVDMPVQREKHTGWPTIAGSSMKGVLRDHCRAIEGDGDRPLTVNQIFGSEPADPEPQAGALSITDARILAFPVRSAKGVFAWITCPAVLERFKRDCALASIANLPANPLPQNASVAEGRAVRCSDEIVVAHNNNSKIILEEFDFSVEINSWQVPLNNFANFISESGVDATTMERFRTHLVLIPDDEFGYFVQHATEVIARIGLDSETKTVEDGALFYEEFLPPETLMYSVVIATPTRCGQGQQSGDKVMRWLRNCIQREPMLQIGGNETIGKGFCLVRLVPDANN
jgi:CRISPR-associated protein Cmr4